MVSRSSLSHFIGSRLRAFQGSPQTLLTDSHAFGQYVATDKPSS